VFFWIRFVEDKTLAALHVAFSRCEKQHLFLSVFPMFVPSLSWQNDRFYIQMAQKCRFSQGLAREDLRTGFDPKGRCGNIFFGRAVLYFAPFNPNICEDRLGTSIGNVE
jgi:hypothetical protein